MSTLTSGQHAEQTARGIKILIADDHELFREGLRHVLLALDQQIAVIESCDFPQTLSLAGCDGEISVVLLDLSMPGMAWIDGLRALREVLPGDVPIIILSASDSRDYVMQAINLGAMGFIPKTSSSRVMTSALKLVLSGGVYLPPAVIRENVSIEPVTCMAAREGLTPRQHDVLALLREGKSNKEIARVLNLAEGTVKLHVTAILRALNVNNRTRAVVAANKTEPVEG